MERERELESPALFPLSRNISHSRGGKGGERTYLVLLQIAEPIEIGTRIEERPRSGRVVILEHRAVVVEERLRG